MSPTGSRLRGWNSVGPVVLAVLIYAGQLKQNPLLSWIPGDLTVLCVIIVVVAALVTRVRSGPATSYVVLPYVAWILFLPAVALTPATEYAQDKVITLFTISLILAVAPFYLLRQAGQRKVFLATFVVIAVLVALYSLFFDQVTANNFSTGLAFDGADTIGTGRIAMTGALVCLILALRGKVLFPSRVALFLLAVSIAFLAVASGSRGPLVAALLAVIVMVCVSPGFKSRRAFSVSLAIVAVGCLVWFASSESNRGGARAFSVFAGESDSSTDARIELWSAAWQQFSTSPLGSGWGGYDSPLSTIHYPHNVLLEIFVEAGILVGSVVFLFTFITVLSSLRIAIEWEEVTMLGLIVFGLFNALVSSDINGSRLLIVAIFSVWSLKRPGVCRQKVRRP
ncbi:O-antigen ligase family protein [Nesterenkonia sp. DZ6]|uniref:O-antigen ligase family protein n=1 Tax=Nesterenkonia sp. DZ6 TaxID=2901229 RepID=UPI001F4CCBDA|nr:O-antigen ligase family protein [Nesterenkonia sp. DZ6]MCH8559405.1 O-antigen ligase family protein [Nesterenkonia sp. DZ6]